MKTVKSILIVMVLLVGVNFSAAAQRRSTVARPGSPYDLVAELYRQSNRNRGPFSQTVSRARVDKYFEKGLADLIWKDAISSKEEVGAIDGDPLFNAQDTDITKLSIHQPSYLDGKAQVSVTFENFRQKQEVIFLLVQQNATWKITDIKYNDGSTLMGILKGNQSQGAAAAAGH